jgi:NodT family efflux transporter outer membrane factor (OMF) lipoprotein
MIQTRHVFYIPLIFFLSACAVGPNYSRPSVVTPSKYKEAVVHKGWKLAQPQDQFSRGEWWKIFNDPRLNALEDQLNSANQNIKVAEAQYEQAKALVDAARASYFPTLTGSAAITRQKQVSTSSLSASSVSRGANTNHSLLLNAAWAPDIWGSVRRSVESSKAGADASAAALAGARLLAQASLAQFYFELRTLDKDQQLHDNTVVAYQKSLKLTENRYTAGVAGLSDVVQARTQLESARSLALNNKILRAQYEHAIAVLIGQPPAMLTLTSMPSTAVPPIIPLQVPSTLLERRPDVGQAERTMAQNNALIGVAVSAYFPVLTLSGAAGITSSGLGPWFSLPLLSWSVGPQLAATLFDGGLRSANIRAARATYEASVASYRQTVLAAFQNVEDNLVALRILKEQAEVQNRAAADARLALKLTLNQYKAGTVAYSNVITAQITAYAAEKSAIDIAGLRMTAAVGLIQALGGGWHTPDEQNKKIN